MYGFIWESRGMTTSYHLEIRTSSDLSRGETVRSEQERRWGLTPSWCGPEARRAGRPNPLTSRWKSGETP